MLHTMSHMGFAHKSRPEASVRRDKGDNQTDVNTEEVGEGLLHITTFVCLSKLKKIKSMRIWSL